MALKSYTGLYEGLKNKTVGRKHEAQIWKAPALWVKLLDDKTIVCHSEPRGRRPQHVATLYPDDTLVVDIHGRHTPTSKKIIEALTPSGAWIRNGKVWVNNVPVTDVLQFKPVAGTRRFVSPLQFIDASNSVHDRCKAVTLADIPAKERLMVELGTYRPQLTISRKVLDYVTGKIEKSRLGSRDIYTLMHAGTHQEIQARVFEEMI